jgi:hypothetical protein
MLLTVRRPIANSYPIEASGWDDQQSFFVEKCELEWNEEADKHLTLTRSLRPGSMIFVRLLQPTSPARSFPVTYHVQPIGTTPEGQQQFRLSPIQPNCGSKVKSE